MPARTDAKSHRLHLFDFSLLFIIKCFLKDLGSKRAKSHWLHLFEFFHCAFSDVSSNCLPVRMHSHIGCICLTFLHCAFSNVSSNCLHKRKQSHIGCICLTFFHCAISYVSSKSLDLNRQSHIGCICSNFSIVRFQMCAQIAWPNIGYTCLFDFSPLCVFKCFLKELGSEKAAHLGEVVAGQAEPVHQNKHLEIAGQISCILSPQDRSVVRDDQIF